MPHQSWRKNFWNLIHSVLEEAKVPILKSGRLELLGDYQITCYCNGEDRTEVQLTHAPLTQIRFFSFVRWKVLELTVEKLDRQKQTENPSSEATQKNSRWSYKDNKAVEWILRVDEVSSIEQWQNWLERNLLY